MARGVDWQRSVPHPLAIAGAAALLLGACAADGQGYGPSAGADTSAAVAQAADALESGDVAAADRGFSSAMRHRPRDPAVLLGMAGLDALDLYPQP